MYLEAHVYSNAIRKLPLIQALFPWTNTATTFQELINKEAFLSKLTHEFAAMLLYKGNYENEIGNKNKNKNKFWKAEYLTKTIEADKAIGRQFRNASASCHPDKFDGKFAAKFTVLAAAYEFLKDYKMRQSYFRHMLQHAFVKHDYEETIQLSHDQWLKEHSHSTISGQEQIRFQEAIQQVQQRTQQPMRVRKIYKDQPLTIQGGLSSTKPRLLGVGEIHRETRMVQMTWQPLHPIDVFRSYCVNVVILIDEENAVVIRNDELGDLYSEHMQEYAKEIHFPSWGVFHVSWFAELIIDGREMNTERSDSVEITVFPSVYERAIEERPALLKMAREMADRLHKELQQFHKQIKIFRTDRIELQKRHETWHRALGGAQSLIHKLENTLKDLDQDPKDHPGSCPQLRVLKQVVKDAAVVHPALVNAMKFFDKKKTRKSFAQAFVVKLAKGDAGTWLVHVSKGELTKMGGDANRLYQLLIETKVDSSFLDSTTLQIASSRSDLFSRKQRKILLELSDKLEAQKRSDLDVLITEPLNQEVAKKESRQNQNEVKKNPKCPHRATNPEIIGLESDTFAPIDGMKISDQYDALTFSWQKGVQTSLGGLKPDTHKMKGITLTPSTATSSRATIDPDIKLPLKYDSHSACSPHKHEIENFGTQAPIGWGRSLELGPQSNHYWASNQGAPFLPLFPSLDAGLSKPLSSMSPLTVASAQSESSNTLGLHSLYEPAQSEQLLEFLHTQKDCLKQTPMDFYEWLLSEDVNDLSALAEAVTLQYFFQEMTNNGLKGFKRQIFKENCLVADYKFGARRVGLASKQLIAYLTTMSLTLENFYKINALAPRHLQCPISSLLMVVNPVIASDGHTYERDSLQGWITSRRESGEPVTSPQTGQEFSDVSVHLNMSVRNIAREFLLSNT